MEVGRYIVVLENDMSHGLGSNKVHMWRTYFYL